MYGWALYLGCNWILTLTAGLAARSWPRWARAVRRESLLSRAALDSSPCATRLFCMRIALPAPRLSA